MYQQQAKPFIGLCAWLESGVLSQFKGDPSSLSVRLKKDGEIKAIFGKCILYSGCLLK
jgi:hypothetical protein